MMGKSEVMVCRGNRLALSMGLVLAFWATTWLAGKNYRIGILDAIGTKPTYKDPWK